MVLDMVTKRKGAAWGLAEAKARLSEVLQQAAQEPQTIKRRGKPVAAVVDIAQFGETQRRALAGSAQQRMQAFLAASGEVRRHGGVELRIAKRRARKSPFTRP
jgi:prevent-host-death family protein